MNNNGFSLHRVWRLQRTVDNVFTRRRLRMVLRLTLTAVAMGWLWSLMSRAADPDSTRMLMLSIQIVLCSAWLYSARYQTIEGISHGSVAYVLLPARTWEKLVSVLLSGLVVVPLLSVLGYLLVDSVVALCASRPLLLLRDHFLLDLGVGYGVGMVLILLFMLYEFSPTPARVILWVVAAAVPMVVITFTSLMLETTQFMWTTPLVALAVLAYALWRVLDGKELQGGRRA